MTSNVKKSGKSPESNGDNACPVCFKDVEIFSIGVCDHPICHECSTRMRVLCKEDACPICRQDLNKVAFVKDVKPYSQLKFNSYLVDKNTRIHFENLAIQEVYEKLLVHICHICPSKPSYASLQVLKDHLRKEHEMFFCDLCVENLKIFSQERRAYTRQELALHRRKGDPDNTSHRGHPLCNFCDKRYVDADELFRHLRRDHYFCHFCDADGLNHYYCAYEDLREHFRDAHFLCEEGDCKEEKFTRVFRTEIDIRAHKAQTHSQSLGKAAVKQARTLELEFTLAPRPGENKGRGAGRRGPSKFADRQDHPTNSTDHHDAKQSSSATNADLGNPEEFPSLSVTSNSVAKNRVAPSDSLAQKLAKNNRFTVRNVGSPDHDEFPSLVTEVSTQMQSENVVPNGKKLPVKPVGQEHSSRFRPGLPDSSHGSSSAEGSHQSKATRNNPYQNLNFHGTRDLRLQNFPSLTPASANSEQPTVKATWVKKEPPKPIKSQTVKQNNPNGKKPVPSPDEYPSLVKTPSNGSSMASMWQTKDKKPKVQMSNPVHPVVQDKKTSLKSNVKYPKADSTPSSQNKVTRKLDEDETPEIRFNPNENSNILTRKAKLLDASSISSSRESNTIGSKISTVKQTDGPSTVDNNGAIPKTKAKPMTLVASDFPVLGASASTVASIFDNSADSSKPKSSENGTQLKVNLTTTSSGTLNNNQLTRTFLQPPDFSTRNQQLIATVMDLLCNQHKKIEKFRTVSAQFRKGFLDPKNYYKECLDIMGDDCFWALFPELVCLLPDISKQQQILKVHRSEMRSRGNTASAEPYVICANCGQVLAPSDLKHHLGSHSLEVHFPTLDTMVDGNVAWNKR